MTANTTLRQDIGNLPACNRDPFPGMILRFGRSDGL